MDQDIRKLHQLQQDGMCCAQILVSMGLALLREENPRLLQAVSGLCGGIQTGMVCGSLTGAAVMLSLFDEELAAKEMIPQLTEWFQHECGAAYGGMDCHTILGESLEGKAMRCPKLVESTYREAREILEEYGFDIESMAEEAF